MGVLVGVFENELGLHPICRFDDKCVECLALGEVENHSDLAGFAGYGSHDDGDDDDGVLW